jgi:hypothetical protein
VNMINRPESDLGGIDMQKTIVRSLCYCAFLTALAVLLQSAPVFLPLAGMALSPLATFPVALACFESKALGAASYAAAGLILLLISPEESLIFFFTTGIMGIPLGIYTRSFIKSIAVTMGFLFGGMNALTFLAGVSIFGDMTPNASFFSSLMPYLLFSAGYAAVWTLIIKYLTKILAKRGISGGDNLRKKM